MVMTTDIYWLAGLLEGEGSFTYSGHCPMVQLQMTDGDIVRRAAAIMGTPLCDRLRRTNMGKQVYGTFAAGGRAIGIMQTVYPLMGARRKEVIRLRISQWRPGRRIDFDRAEEIRALIRDGMTMKDIAAKLELPYSMIWKIGAGKSWLSRHPRSRNRV